MHIVQVNRADGEMPENAKSTDEESIPEKTVSLVYGCDGMDAVYKALDIDLEEPLRPEELVQAPKPYVLRDVCHSAQQDGLVYNSAAMPLRVYNGLSASATTNGHPMERRNKAKKTKTSKERALKFVVLNTALQAIGRVVDCSEATEAAEKALNEASKTTRVGVLYYIFGILSVSVDSYLIHWLQLLSSRDIFKEIKKAEKKSKDTKRKSKRSEMIEEPIDKDVYEVR
uniref:Uncharacterized protein n=1 Tax=Parascaris equorum TaxID=6256 RepID=A0A914S7V3_PAREQ